MKIDYLALIRAVNRLEALRSTTDNSSIIERIDAQIKVRKDAIQTQFGRSDITIDEVKAINRQNGHLAATDTIKRLYGGNGNPMDVEAFVEKIPATMLSKYGKENYTQTDKYKEDMHRSNMSRRYDTIIAVSSYVEPLFNKEFYIEKSKDPSYLFRWKCKECNNVFFAKFYNGEFKPARCVRCHPRNYTTSKGEKDLRTYIESLGVTTVANCKSLISNAEIDIVCPDYKLCIEYDGDYYHSTARIDDTNYHTNKTDMCYSIGYRLLHVFEDEWLSRSKVCKRLVRSIISNEEVTVSNGVIKEGVKSSFFDENSLCLYRGNTTFGYYKDDLLIAAMSLSKKSDGSWWLIDFCCNTELEVSINVYAELFKFFVTNYKPLSVRSFVDRRYSVGKVEVFLGFSLTAKTAPNYYYVVKNRRDLATNWTKDQQKLKLKNFDEELSEEDNMTNNGYNRIYDCGYMIFDWRNNGN